MADRIDVNALIAAAEKAAVEQSQAAAKAKVKLPTNARIDKMFNFGIEPNLPLKDTGFLYDQVVDNNTGYVLGYVKNGKFVQTIDQLPSAPVKKDAPPKPQVPNFTDPNATLAKSLQSEINDYTDQIQEIARRITTNAALPTDRKDLAYLAKQYNSIVASQKQAYVNTGLVQGDPKIDKNGNLSIENVFTPKATAQGAPVSSSTSISATGPIPAGYTNPTSSKEITDRYAGMKTTPDGKPIVTNAVSGTISTGQQPSVSSSGTKKVVETPAAKPVLTPDDFMAQYGVQAALINSDPELKKLFDEASKNSWTADKFASQFLNTNWSKTHAQTWQAAETARLSAPATYAQSYNNMRNAIARLTGTMGETLTPDQLGKEVTDFSKPVDRNPNDIVQWALDQSWGKGADTAAIKQHIAELGKINLAMPGGETANTMMTLKQFAGDMGMGNLALKGGTDYFSKAAESMLLGKSTIDTWKNDILSQAKTRYSAFAPAFDSGQTLRTVSAPYLNSIANLLEVPVDQIDLSSSTGYGKMVTDALTGTDPANPKPTALYDFQKAIKNLPEWGYTNNARDSVMPGVHGLLQLFGKVGA